VNPELPNTDQQCRLVRSSVQQEATDRRDVVIGANWRERCGRNDFWRRP